MQVKVWNDNVHPHRENFKEREIVIPPKSFIEMDYEEAVEFKCQFTPIQTDGEKNPLPQSFKMIRVEQPAQKTAAPLVCHATGKVANSVEELARMNAEHVGQLEEGARREVEERVQMKSELDELRAQVAALTAEKRGPGRPRKEA